MTDSPHSCAGEVHYIKISYNRKRRHFSIDYVTTKKYETALLAA